MTTNQTKHEANIKRFKQLAFDIIGDLMDAKMHVWAGTDEQTLSEEIYWLEAIALQVKPMVKHEPIAKEHGQCECGVVGCVLS